MTLAEVRDWLRGLSAKADNYYCGALDAKKMHSLGVYQNKRVTTRLIALGRATKHRIKRVSLLVHWSENSVETERFAQALYDEISIAQNVQIGTARVSYIELKTDEPIEVGQDENGVFERVIELDIHYQD